MAKVILEIELPEYPHNNVESGSLIDLFKNKLTAWNLVEIFFPKYNDSIEIQTYLAIEEVLTEDPDTWSSDADLVWHTLGKDMQKIDKAKDQSLKEIYQITLESMIKGAKANVIYSEDNQKTYKLKS